MRSQIVTERLILRDAVPSDAELFFELDSDPAVTRYLGPWKPQELDWYRERIRTVYMPWQEHPWHGLWVVLDRATEEFLGWVFVRPSNQSRDACDLGWTRADEIEVGYRYRQPAWGRGVATEAARPLVDLALADPEVTAVVGCADIDNFASLRVLEKLGLTRVGETVIEGEIGPTAKLERRK